MTTLSTRPFGCPPATGPRLTPRALATAAGIVLVGATAHMTILKTGGYGLTTQCPLVIALALGVIAAARAIGSGELGGRLALFIGLTLLAGEAYNFASTLDRMIETREEAQAPRKALAAKRDEALATLEKLATGPIAETPRLVQARLSLNALRSGSEGPAVKAARAALAEKQQRVDEEAANIRCGKQCERKQGERDTAQGALDKAIAMEASTRAADLARAQAEVTAAATEAATLHAASLKEAKAIVEANPLPPSATPTADRLGWAPWAWDMLIAALLSFAAAGLAAGLLAMGAATPEATFAAAKLKATANAKTSDLAAYFSGEQTERLPENDPPQPPKGGPRKRKTSPANESTAAKDGHTATIYPFPANHPVVAALKAAGGSVSSNRQLAALMGVTDGEATKRRQEVEHLLTVEHDGKSRRIALKA